MDKFSGPKDIYEELVENAPHDEDWLLGLVAFAVIEEQKIEWMEHQVKNTGSLPSTQDIDHWYQQQTSGVLLRARDTARARLTDFVEASISLYEDDIQREIEEKVIVREIREIKKFWPLFGVNLAGGFASALLFAALLTLFAFLVYSNASPIDLGEEIGRQLNQEAQPEEVIENE